MCRCSRLRGPTPASSRSPGGWLAFLTRCATRSRSTSHLLVRVLVALVDRAVDLVVASAAGS